MYWREGWLLVGKYQWLSPPRRRVPAWGGELVYDVGSTSDRGRKIRDAAAWGREVQTLAAHIAAPVKVSVSAPAPK